MMINKQNAKEWVERFMNGETNNDEEQALYRFFAQKGLPRELKKYQAMFAWYAGGMKEPLPVHTHHRHIRQLYIRISIAAAIVLASGAGVKYYLAYQQQQEELEIYEGSYIIRNGKKITDLKKILPELKRSDRMAEERERRIEQEVSETPEDIIREAKQKGPDQNQENIPTI